MSKPKPRASEPIRTPAQPAHWDKNPAGGGAKFYDGPTVAAGSKGKSPAKGAKPVQAADYRQVVVKPAPPVTAARTTSKRKKLTITSLLTLIPFFLFASLFSTVLCPPSTAQPSSFSRAALSSIGLAHSADEHSQFHKTLCYPANVYHDEVLVPYVYPAVEDVKARLQAHPVYTNSIEPGVRTVKTHADRIWKSSLGPVVDRAGRVAHKMHLTYVQPHVPFVKAKFTEATAPITLRAHELYKVHVGPHWKVVKMYIAAIMKQIQATYYQVIGHPVSKLAHKHGLHAFHIGKHHSHRAYLAGRPHAIRAWNEGKRHTHDTIIPRAVQAIQLASNQVARFWLIVKGHAADLYKKHAAQHLDPYLHKAGVVLSPYYKLVNEKVYRPYIFPLIASVVPIPEKPKSFWQMISDFLPSPGSTHVGDRGSAFYAEEKKQQAADKVKQATKEAGKAKESVKGKAAKSAESVKAKAAKSTDSVKAEAAKSTESVKTQAKKEDIRARAESVKNKVTDSVKAQAEAVKEKVAPVASSASSAASSASSAATEQASTVQQQGTVAQGQASRAAQTAQEVVDSIKSGIVENAASVGSSVSSAAYSAAPTEVDEKAAKHDVDNKILLLKKLVNFQGKTYYARVQSEVIKNGEHFISLIPELARMGDENLQREITRMVTGLDKLYTNSKTLTKDQVDESQRMSDAKVKKALTQVNDGIKVSKNNVYKKSEHAVEKAKADLEKLVGKEYEALGKDLSLLESTTQKDWDLYHSIKADVKTWQAKFPEAPTKAMSKELKDLTHKVEVKAAEVLNDFKEVYLSWTERQTQLKRTALDRIEARKAMRSEDAEKARTQLHRAKASKSKSADFGRVSIQPVLDNNDAAAGDGNPIIGKSKEQVIEAVKKAEKNAKAASASPTQSGDAGRVSILPIEEEDAAAAREGTPIIGKSKEQVLEALEALKEADEAAAAASASRSAKAEL